MNNNLDNKLNIKCGIIAIIGKPNVGKSTLINALVGQKISITSSKAQTTRHRILGINNKGNNQFIFTDTPGFQTKYSKALNKSLNKAVLGTISDVDLILFVVEANKFDLNDAKVLSLFKDNIPVILIANKLDKVYRRFELAPWLKKMQERFSFAEYVPMSAKNKTDINNLFKICEKYLPIQPWFYNNETLTDKNEKFLTSEILREKIFRLTGDELPYTSTIIINEFKEEKSKKYNRFIEINATIIIEKESQKAIIIGKNGDLLKRINTEARQDLEKLLNAKIFLKSWIKVRSGWADDEAYLKSFGYS